MPETGDVNVLKHSVWGDLVELRLPDLDGWKLSDAVEDVLSERLAGAVLVDLLDSKVVFGNEAGGAFVHAAFDRRLRALRPAAIVTKNKSLRGLYGMSAGTRAMSIRFFEDVESARAYLLSQLDATATRVADALGNFECEDIRRPDPAVNVWDASEPGFFAHSKKERRERLESLRNLTLGTLAMRADTFVQTLDTPRDYDVPGEWIAEGEATWRVPQGFDFRDERSEHWLALGGWTQYCGGRPISRIPDLFQKSPKETVDWMRTNDIEMVASSFADDREWRVAVRDRSGTESVDS